MPTIWCFIWFINSLATLRTCLWNKKYGRKFNLRENRKHIKSSDANWSQR